MKRNMHRIISLLLIAAMLIPLLPFPAEGCRFHSDLTNPNLVSTGNTVSMAQDSLDSAESSAGIHVPNSEDNHASVSEDTPQTDGNFYRWEIRDNVLVSTGTTENMPQLLAGSVTNGTINAARYQLAKSVKLYHDRPWIIQWCCTGDWSGLLLAENTTKEKYLFETSTDTGLLAFGCNYEHYGISLAELGIDRNVPHTFRLENRTESDGSNMVYLYVDGEEIGPMNNHYYTGNVNRNEKVDWLNGQDFTFSYLGTGTNLIQNLKLDYLQILDSGCTHTYKSTYTEPTCTKAGYVIHICTTCGAFYRDGHEDALGHDYVEGVCTRCLKPESLIGAGWSPVPFSTTQVSDHLAYKIEDGVLTFHDFGDPDAEDHGILPDYTNTNVVETKYNITEWYQSRSGIQKVVFDETIRDIGAYTLTNMDQITEIRIENPNTVLATHLCLFSTENRAEPLRIYAASTVKTVESWIRGNGNRKITAAVPDVVLYYTDLEPMAHQLKALETALGTGSDVDPLTLWQALRLLEDIPHPNYTISDYRCAIDSTEDILERLWELTSGPCGEKLTYHLTAMEQEGKLNLHITGKGAMTQYSDPAQAPWYDVMDCISDITVGDLVTGIHDPILPAGATYHVHLNSEAYAIAKEKGCKIQLDTLRILLIGNSHTADYSEFRSNILADLKNAGLETDIVITRTIIGSTGLYSGRISKKDPTHSSHLEYIENNAGAYSNLKNYRYDLIVVQDYMESIIDTPEVFSAGLASFIGTVKTVAAENGQGTPQVAWFADWVDIRTTGGDNALYDGDGNKINLPVRTRAEVYAHSLANIAWIEAGIAQGAENMPDFVIHGVTIKQNAMSSYLGQTKIFDNSKYCLLERDTTHMTYELGRYLMGAGVFSEILEHYRSLLVMTDPAMTVGSALTLENGPVASGTGSQYSGAVNVEILQIIREAISSTDVFQQSVYVTDPVNAFVDDLSQAQWDLSGVTDATSALNAATEQISELGSHLENITVALTEYTSPTQFKVTVQISHGYTIRKTTVLIHSCRYDSVVTAPTCTEQGYTTYTCPECGDSYTDSYVDALGHTFSNSFCTVCGKQENTTTTPIDEGMFVTITPENYLTISNPATEKLACGPCLVTYGDGKMAVAYLADDVNTTETESSQTIVCRLGLFNFNSPQNVTFLDIAAAGQTIGDATIGQKAPYEPNLLVLENGNLLVLFNIRDTSGKYIYYSATVDPESKTVTDYTPLTLDGKPWIPANIAASYNAIADNSISSSGPTGSMVFTSQIVNHGGYYYGYCGGICAGFSGILVRSTDGINWTSVMSPEALPEMAGVIECGFQFYDDYIYFCMRDISSGVYQCSYNFATGDQMVGTHKLSNLTTSKPTAFIQNGKLYLIVNKATGDDATVGRRNTALFYEVDPESCHLTLVRQIFCADGCAYHSVVNVNGVNYWAFHTDARRINPYTQGRSNLAFREIPALYSHTYESVVTAPTCTEPGYTTHTCTICGSSYVDSYVEAVGHRYESNICIGCGKEKSGILNMTDYSHMYASGCITVAANVWQSGVVNYHYQIPLSDFTDYNQVTFKANSTNKTYVAFFTQRMTTAGAIAYAEGWTEVLILDPGTTQTLSIPTDAQYMYILNNNAAGDSLLPESVVFSKTETEQHTHAYKSTFTEPTCTDQGYVTHICTTCGHSYVNGQVDALGHDYGVWYVVDEDTRQRDCSQCGHTKTFTRLSLPLYYSGEVYVESNPDGLYCGTRNVADLLGLKSGTYTNGDVTITIDGTAITVKGTPAKTLYFDLQAGTFGTPDYKRDPGYSLPDGDYRFGLIGSGTAYPTACIRYPDGVGNLVATSGVIGAADLSGSDFGIPYLYVPTGKTYDFSGQLILAHGSDSTYDGDAARTEKIEGIGDFTVNGYLWTPGQAAVFGDLASRNTGKLIYTDGSKEYIDIYLPQETGYLQIQMNLANSTSTNAYGWRLNMMYACDNRLSKKFPVTNAGEYEAAIKIDGRPDFMGMGAHGSERMTSFTIYIDGVEVDLDQLAVLTDWTSIRIVRESDFYDPLDETTLVAIHTVIYDYDLTGLTVTQDVNWLVDSTCIFSYMMMFPVRRAYEGHQITDTYFDNFSATEYDVSQEGFTTYPLQWTTGATKMTLYSERSGVTATMESLETSVLTGTGYKRVANAASYNKLYFTICGGGGSKHTVTAGDQWHTSHRYEVTLTQGTDTALSCVYGHTPGDPVVENEGPHGSHDTVTYCTICGEELSREHDNGYLPGDINGDGAVNNKDITRLFQYLSDYDVEVVEEALDVNGDGAVNNKDLTRLFQYLSDYEVDLH